MWTLIRARQRHRRALRLWRGGHRLRAVDLCRRAVTGLAGAELAAALLTLGDLEFRLTHHAAAATALRRAAALLGPDHPLAVPAAVRLGDALRVQGRLREAEEVLLAAGPHPAVRNALGVVCKDAGRYAEAAAHYAAALHAVTADSATPTPPAVLPGAGRRAASVAGVPSDDGRRVAAVLPDSGGRAASVAGVLPGVGRRVASAAAVLPDSGGRAVSVAGVLPGVGRRVALVAAGGGGAGSVAGAELFAVLQHNIAGLAHVQGRFADAEAPARAALATHERLHGAGSAQAAADAAVLGAVLLGLRRFAESEAVLRRAVAAWTGIAGPAHHEVAGCLHTLGVLHHLRGRRAAALRTLGRALRLKTAALGPDHHEVGAILNNLAAVHAACGRAHAARCRSHTARAARLLARTGRPAAVRRGHHLARRTVHVACSRSHGGQSRACRDRAVGILTRALGPQHPFTRRAGGRRPAAAPV